MAIAKHAGRSTRRFKQIAASARKAWRAKGLSCCECHQPLDWTLEPNDRMYPTLAHLDSVRDHPEKADNPANVKGIAHRACNSAAGAGEGLPDLGTTSHDW